MEIWRDIQGYEGLYQVSNYGRVKSLERNFTNGINGCTIKHIDEHILIPQNEKGYLRVNLYKNGKQKFCSIHRLVAEAFIPNPNNYPQVNHKDEDKANNKITNLEWCTAQYNNTYGTCKKRMAETQSKTVYQYTLDGELAREWSSTAECGRNGFNRNHISSCCNGRLKTHKGYKWSYEPL